MSGFVVGWCQKMMLSYLCLLIVARRSIICNKIKTWRIATMIRRLKQNEIIGIHFFIFLFLFAFGNTKSGQGIKPFQRKKQATKTNIFSIPEKVNSRNRILCDSCVLTFNYMQEITRSIYLCYLPLSLSSLCSAEYWTSGTNVGKITRVSRDFLFSFFLNSFSEENKIY